MTIDNTITAIRNADLENISDVNCKTKDLVKLVNHIYKLEAINRKKEITITMLDTQMELLQSSLIKAAGHQPISLNELV